MPLIEGLGDEVTLVMGAVLVCVVLTLAWFSTHTADLPALREVGITVIERTQIRRRVPEQSQDSGSLSLEPDGGLSIRFRRQTQENGQISANAESGSTVADVAVASTSAASTSQTGGTDNTISGGEVRADSVQPAVGNVVQEVEASQPSDSPSAAAPPSSPDTEPINDSGADNHSVPDSKPVVGEELRRRRVQFFQNPQTASGGDNHHAAASILHSEIDESTSCVTDSTEKPTGLSEHSRLETNDANQLSEASHQDSTVPSSQPSTSDNGGSAHPSTSDNGGSAQPSISDNGSSAQPSPSSPSSATIRVKLKYMNETQRMVHASPTDTIGDFRRTHFEEELQDQNKWVRFIFNGQDLRDDSATLQAYQVGDNCTMHCLITNKVRTTPGGATGAGGRAGDEDDEDSVMGALMYPLFTLVLMVVWYFRLTYRQYFSPMSTVVLIGISFLLGLGYFSSLRTAAAAGNQRQQAGAGGGRPAQRQDRPQMGHAHAD